MNSSQATPQPSKPFVPRVYTGPDDLSRDAATLAIGAMTLRQFHDIIRTPALQADKTKPQTIADYGTALKRWEAWTRTEDSPTEYVIDDITQELLDRFHVAVSEGDESPATINKWFRYLRAIFNHLGRKSRANKRAVHYWDEVPFLTTLPEDDPDPVELPSCELSALYEASDVATWPPPRRTGISAATWWKVSQVTLLNCGMRRDDWLYLPSDAINIAQQILTFKARKTGKTHCLVMHDVVKMHLQMLAGGREFPFCPTQSHMQLYRQWHLIQDAAGVRPCGGGHYGFHALRQTAASRFNEFFPGTAELLLGHALPKEKRVTAKNYIGRNMLKPLWKAMREIEQPEAYIVGCAADRKTS